MVESILNLLTSSLWSWAATNSFDNVCLLMLFIVYIIKVIHCVTFTYINKKSVFLNKIESSFFISQLISQSYQITIETFFAIVCVNVGILVYG